MSLYTNHCGPDERAARERAARIRQALRNPPMAKLQEAPTPPTPPTPIRQPDPPKPAPAAVEMPEKKPRKITVSSVIDAAAAYFKTSPADLAGPAKHWPLVQYRHIAVYVAYQATTRSFPHIGRAFRRDHSTVFHACRRVQERLDAGDPVAGEAVKAIVEKLGLSWPCERPPAPPRSPVIIKRCEPPADAQNHGLPWSVEEMAELCRLYQENHSRSYIASALRRRPEGIITKASKLGIASRYGKNRRREKIA